MATVFNDTGKAYVAAKLDGTNTNPPHFIGWGTGAGTANKTDTTLFTEAAEARAVGAKSRVTTTVTNDTFQVVGTLTSLSGQTITNTGVFDASTTGNLVVKADHTGLPLLTNDSIQYTWKLAFS
jgi:hypothetical protein